MDLAARALEAVSPLAVLQRGYSITRDADGRAVRAADELAPGARIESVLQGGVVRSDVVEVDADGEA